MLHTLARVHTELKPPVADWRHEERHRQALAARLHEAAACDLACAPHLYAAVPTDGPVDDVLAARTRSDIPSVHISRAAGRLAVGVCLVEMSRRADGNLCWTGTSLAAPVQELGVIAPDLFPPGLSGLCRELPRLHDASAEIEHLTDVDLVRLAGRAFEIGLSLFWVFRDAESAPRRLWDPWRAKQQGCFFTPRFVAEYLAARALESNDDSVLDPAVGAGALLLEAFLVLRDRYGADEAHGRLYGVDASPDLVALSAISLAFAAGEWRDDLPESVGRQFVCGDSLLAPLDGPESWTEWFPNAMADGGFGAVVMNPPYGQLKINHSSLPESATDDAATCEARDRALHVARARVATTAAALRSHADYRFAQGGVPDLPRFFLERSLSLLKAGGVKSSIVPSTFLADHRSARLRRHLLEDRRVIAIDLIPEDARLFVGVNQPTCVITVASDGPTDDIAIRRTVLGPTELKSLPELSLSAELVATVDPVERRIPDCGQRATKLLATMHDHPRVADYAWIDNLRGELDLTLSREFLRRSGGVPLVRGDQIERYRSDLPSEKESYASLEFVDAVMSSRKFHHYERARIVGRQCSYLRKARRFSFALIPPRRVVGNSCNYVAVDGQTAPIAESDALLYLLAVLNSGWMEWRFRLTSSTNHVGNYEIASLPIPAPTDASLVCAIIKLAGRLTASPDDAVADRELEKLIGEELFGLAGSPPL